MNKFYKKFLGMGLSLLFLMPSPIMANAENSQEVNINSLQKTNVENSQEININNSQKPNVENSQEINIDNSQKPNALYKKGIAFGAIDPSEVSEANWEKQEKDYKENYRISVERGIITGLSYEQWLEANNYGQFPKLNSELFDEIVIPPSSGRQKRSAGNNVEILSGDILVTNATSAWGVLGHAAIANGNGYILDMPGERKGRSAHDNNRQSTAREWFNDYRDGWKHVFRLKNRSVARQVGRYADRHYYSTNGSATKNVHIDYKISPDLYNMRTAYCSKLVFCAYWYGSGSLPVMKPVRGFVSPRDLVNCFTESYKPVRIN